MRQPIIEVYLSYIDYWGEPIGSGKLRRRIIDLSLGCIEKFGLVCFSFHLNFNLVYSVSKFPTPNTHIIHLHTRRVEPMHLHRLQYFYRDKPTACTGVFLLFLSWILSGCIGVSSIGSGKLRRRIIDLSLGCMSKLV